MEQLAAQQRGSRNCGSCTACCTILGVAELNKPNYTPCLHECKAGCAIYSTRPVSCRVWSCNWLYGREPGGDERRRPDQLGLMFTHEEFGRRGKILTAYEVWPGAAKEPRADFLLRKLTARGQFVLVLSGAGPGGQSRPSDWSARLPERRHRTCRRNQERTPIRTANPGRLHAAAGRSEQPHAAPPGRRCLAYIHRAVRA